MLNISVGDAPAELRAAVLAMKRADATVRRDVATRMRQTMGPVWAGELSQHLTGWPNEGRMLTAGARIAGGNPAQLVTATSRRKVGRGLIPAEHWAGYEYGANRDAWTTVRGRRGTYKRRVKRHLPARTKGRVIERAVVRVLPRVAAYWTQSVVRAFMDAVERKG